VLPQENEQLQDRIKKAASYFSDRLENVFTNNFKSVIFDSDNKEIKKSISEAVEKFELSLFVKIQSLAKTINGFETILYLKSVADADLDFVAKFNKKVSYSSVESSSSSHNELFLEINAWRKAISSEANVPVFMVMPQKTLKELVEKMPLNIKQLAKIKGFGKVKVNQYGDEIIEIIENYCNKYGISRDATEIEELKPKKTAKPDTKIVSLELYKQGKSLAEIAQERGFVESTIFGHLSHFVLLGEIEINALISDDRLYEITSYLENRDTSSLGQLIQESNGRYSYNEFRLVLSYLQKGN
jgi:hypothetical protein